MKLFLTNNTTNLLLLFPHNNEKITRTKKYGHDLNTFSSLRIKFEGSQKE